jgi:hypothetical protein
MFAIAPAKRKSAEIEKRFAMTTRKSPTTEETFGRIKVNCEMLAAS